MFKFNNIFNEIVNRSKIKEIRIFAFIIAVLISISFILHHISWEGTSFIMFIVSCGAIIMFGCQISGLFISIKKHVNYINKLINSKLYNLFKLVDSYKLSSKIDNSEYKLRNNDTAKYELNLLRNFNNDKEILFWNKMYLNAKFVYDGCLSMLFNKMYNVSEKLELVILSNLLSINSIKIKDDKGLYNGNYYNVKSDGLSLTIDLFNVSHTDFEYSEFKNLYLLFMQNSVGYLDIIIKDISLRIEGAELENFQKFIIEYYNTVQNTIDRLEK